MMIIWYCIIYLDYHKLKMKGLEEDFSITLNPLYDNLFLLIMPLIYKSKAAFLIAMISVYVTVVFMSSII